jgi:hypothetical protein
MPSCRYRVVIGDTRPAGNQVRLCRTYFAEGLLPGTHLKKSIFRVLPLAIAITFCAPAAKAYTGDDVMRAASACDRGNAKACQVILPIAIANCQAGNAQACWIAGTLRSRGITQGELLQVASPGGIVGIWGTSSTPIYSNGPSYGLTYTFNPDGTYIFASNFGTAARQLHGKRLDCDPYRHRACSSPKNNGLGLRRQWIW